jgi:hypothetical protein
VIETKVAIAVAGESFRSNQQARDFLTAARDFLVSNHG